MKGLMKVFSSGSAMWREWKMIGLLIVYIRECVGNHSVRRLWRRWDTMKDCLRKRCLDVRQARRMVQDSSEWQIFMRGNALGITQGMIP